ncbi:MULTISPECIES: dTDP-4-dehydrorhamnose reductase family protein [Bacillaceae]|uniref:dTDP-4-dehydrorhamnose reductase family protein n=1 Tax=Bacillaceae TaxID=186817 RepID=UPI002FFFFD89
MKILVLGGTGMAGHLIKEYFSGQKQHEVWWTTRKIDESNANSVILDVRNRDAVKRTIEHLQPNVVINAVGILNDSAAQNVLDSITVNSILPQFLAKLSYQLNFYLIHISTDCVFSGSKGDYGEQDAKDGSSVYAQTKSLGEIVDSKNLTIRTSIIGPELKSDGIGLFHWFMHQTGQVKGYKKVFWNGITTLELAKTIERILANPVSGLIHLTSKNKISKYDLLNLLKVNFAKKDVTILPDDQIISDKSLVMTRKDIPFVPKDYKDMISELYKWMQKHCHLYHQYFR